MLGLPAPDVILERTEGIRTVYVPMRQAVKQFHVCPACKKATTVTLMMAVDGRSRGMGCRLPGGCGHRWAEPRG